MRIVLVLLLLGFSAAPARAQLPADDAVRRLVARDDVTAATTFLERDHDSLVRELITLTEIPAPPF